MWGHVVKSSKVDLTKYRIWGVLAFVPTWWRMIKIALAIVELLSDESKRVSYGDNLRKRVGTFYVTEKAAAAYGDLYAKYCDFEPEPSVKSESN